MEKACELCVYKKDTYGCQFITFCNTIMEDKNTTLKKCSRCGRELPLDAFGNKKGTKDGKQHWCKQCLAKANHDAWMAKHPDSKRYPARNLPKEGPVQASPDINNQLIKMDPPKESITGGILQSFTAAQLVEDLRARGYEVTCKKITVEEL